MEPIRVWENSDFRLEIGDVFKVRGDREYHEYRLYHKGELLFEGTEYSPSPMIGADSDAAVADLLGFLSLSEGDTEDEYFAEYTEDQLAFARSAACEELSLLALELEENARAC